MTLTTASYLTADIPPVGGRLRARIEDFIVEELPLYQPCGEGEHIYLFIEKRNLSTMQMVYTLAKHFGVRTGDIGYAGMKDKFAVTTQVVSVHTPKRTYADFPMIENDRLTVLSAAMHTNKLRLGHLKGNRFSIRIRDVPMTGAVAARKVLSRLESKGVPNLAGEQRFGVRGNNHVLGQMMLQRRWQDVLDELLGPDERFPTLNAEAREFYAKGEFGKALDHFPNACRYERIALRVLEQGGGARRAVESVELTQRRFWFSALQSAIFNRLLQRRMEDGLFDRVVDGDVALKMENGAPFPVDEATARDPETAARVARFEISASGPLWGVNMRRASGPVDAAELAALAEFDLDLDSLVEATKQLGRAMSGGRRAYRIMLREPSVEGGVDEHGPYIKCGFELPAGSFATVVMREIMKNDQLLGEAEEEA